MLKSFSIALCGCLLVLSLQGIAQPFPDDFIPLDTQQSYHGELGENQVVRFFFTLEQTSDIRLESRTPNRSNTVFPDAVLFTAEGRVVTRDWSSGQGRNFLIQRRLQPGTYVLRVEDGRGCGSLHGCPEIIRDYEVILQVTEVSPF